MDPPSPAGPGYRPLFASGNFAPHPHHLEVFYHVARRGGIRAAARHMPYGVGPSAISEQIIELEAGVGRNCSSENRSG